MTREQYDAMYAHLAPGMIVEFDVRGYRHGKISKIFQIDGVSYAEIFVQRRGYIEHFPRVGFPRINVLSRVLTTKPFDLFPSEGK